MISFSRLSLSQAEAHHKQLASSPERGCEYAFANLFLWGKQLTAPLHGCTAFFSHFEGRSVYPFPIGDGDKTAVIEEIILDAKERGIPCRITSILPEDKDFLETQFPGRFHIRCDRDSFDYVYDIHDLADLKGRKYQRKRNHYNRFRAAHPDCRLLPLDCSTMEDAQIMVDGWFRERLRSDPQGDYLLENIAMVRAFRHFHGLRLEGCVLEDHGQILAVSIASRLSDNTFDIHFEKARDDVDGAYTAINCEFARYLREKYPELEFLNREDDLGMEGLRKAKLSYLPHHMVEKYWAYLTEEINED